MKAWLLMALIVAPASAETLDNRGFIPSSRSRSRSVAASHAKAVHQGGGTVAHVAGPSARAASAGQAIGSNDAPSSSGVAALNPKEIHKPKVQRRRLTGDLTPIPGVAGPSVAVAGTKAEQPGAPAASRAGFTTAAAGAPIGVDPKRSQNTGGAGAFVGDKDSAPGSQPGSGQDSSSAASADPLGDVLNNIKKMFSGLFGGAS